MVKYTRDNLKTILKYFMFKTLRHKVSYLIGQKNVGQKWRNFSKVTKILSDEIFCPTKIFVQTKNFNLVPLCGYVTLKSCFSCTLERGDGSKGKYFGQKRPPEGGGIALLKNREEVYQNKKTVKLPYMILSIHILLV